MDHVVWLPPVTDTADAHVSTKDPRTVQKQQSFPTEKPRKSVSVGRGKKGNTAILRRKNGLRLLQTPDLIADDQLGIHGAGGDLHAKCSRVPP